MKSSARNGYHALGKILLLAVLPLMRKIIKHTERSYVMILCGQEVLLVRSWLSKQTWELPGGGQKAGEQAVNAAQREVHEEVGIALHTTDLQPVVNGRWQTDRLGFGYSIFAVTKKIKPPVARRALEIIDAQWYPLDQLPEDMSAEVRQAIQIYRSGR